jgi:hypothetical protein
MGIPGEGGEESRSPQGFEGGEWDYRRGRPEMESSLLFDRVQLAAAYYFNLFLLGSLGLEKKKKYT